MNKVLLLPLIFLAITACKCSKSAVKQDVKQDQVVVSSPSPVNDDPKKSLPDTIRLVVSFISIGEGTDQTAGEKLRVAIDEFAAKNGIRPAGIAIPWGREGEVDNCFLLNELKPAQQVEFVAAIRKAFEGSKLVQVIENMKNRFRR